MARAGWRRGYAADCKATAFPAEINAQAENCYQDRPGITREPDTGIITVANPEKESPGALTGATGADSIANELADESYDHRAAIARRQPLTDWNRSRWGWKRAVKRDPRLTKTAKLIAITLCDDFAHHESARCHPFIMTLCEATGDPERTVRRALADLEAAGWIARHKGRGRGRPSEIAFTADRAAGAIIPDNVTELAGYRASAPGDRPSERVSPVAGQDRGHRKSDRPNDASRPATHGQSLLEPKRTNNAGAREAALQRPVAFGRIVPQSSEAEREWQAWLAEKGLPDLWQIGLLTDGGWDLPWTWPPRAENVEQTRLAVRFMEWAATVSAVTRKRGAA